MRPRERFLTTIAGKEPDRVPFFEQGIASHLASEVLGRRAQTGGGCFRRDGIEASLRGPEAYEEYRQTYLQDSGDLAEALEFDCIAAPWAHGKTEARKLDDNTYLLGDPRESWRIVRCDPDSDVLYELEDDADRGGRVALERRVNRLEQDHARRQPLGPADLPELRYLLNRLRGRLAVLSGSGIGIPIVGCGKSLNGSGKVQEGPPPGPGGVWGVPKTIKNFLIPTSCLGTLLAFTTKLGSVARARHRGLCARRGR